MENTNTELPGIETGMDADTLDNLEALAKAATPQNFDSAQIQNQGHIECPTCDGSGEVELTADYCNYDGRAIGVQFYGIGPEYRAAEAFYRAANPQAVQQLIALARSAITQQAEAPQEPADHTVDDSELARKIMVFLGRATTASMEPGADPLRDRLAERLALWRPASAQGAAQAPAAQAVSAITKEDERLYHENAFAMYASDDLAASPASTPEASQQAATVTAPAQKDTPESMAASNARFAIDGAIQFGRENRNPPPSTDHWLYEYWNIGQQLRELGKTGWDNVTPLATERCSHCDGTGDVHTPTGEWRGPCTCPAAATVTEPAAPSDERTLMSMFQRDAERHLGSPMVTYAPGFQKDDDGGYQYAATRRLFAFWRAALAAPAAQQAAPANCSPNCFWGDCPPCVGAAPATAGMVEDAKPCPRYEGRVGRPDGSWSMWLPIIANTDDEAEAWSKRGAPGVHAEWRAAQQAQASAKEDERCPHCDGTGDVHRPDGEWMGACTCPAGAKEGGAMGDDLKGDEA